MAVIETRGLSKSFKIQRGEVEAVKGVDLGIREGEVFGLLGPNGAGKTTTLRMLATLFEPGGGQATVAGCDLLREPARVRERIGYVSQAGGTDPGASGRENLVLQGQLYGMNRATVQKRIRDLISTLELGAFVDRSAKTYSGGQKRRLDLAIGLVNEPPILFLDEPTTGLDPQSRARVWEEIERLGEEGTTVFLTTHYMDEADALCQRLAIMDDGLVVAEGTPEELKQEIAGDVVTLGLGDHNGATERTRELLNARPFVREIEVLGETTLRLYVDRGEKALPEILRALDGTDIGVQDLSLSRPTLDDVFLKQTGRFLREADPSLPSSDADQQEKERTP